MSEKEATTVQVTCPCCGANLTIDASLPAVLDHRLPAKPHALRQMRDVTRVLEEEATRRQEKVQHILEAEKNKSKILDRKFQELLKKAKKEPLEKPIKDIDLD